MQSSLFKEKAHFHQIHSHSYILGRHLSETDQLNSLHNLNMTKVRRDMYIHKSYILNFPNKKN